MPPVFKAIADHALLVSFADRIDPAAHAQVLALDKAIAAHPPVGLIETIHALVNILVSFDPLISDHDAMKNTVRTILASLQINDVTGVNRTVQVCYDGDFAPDLDAVATAIGLSRDAVVNAHLAGDFQVLMYGFSPGYAYLSGVPDTIQVPRKPTPVRDVPAGSVIIAGAQCLVTTLTMPTGWSIIGRSPTPILTGDPDHPFLFDVGDHVTFQRVDLDAMMRLTKRAIP